MPESYPYIISNNKIEPILAKIRTAAKPERFSVKTVLTNWGFTASNDRAILAVLKGLGFLTESGAPTEHYDRLRDPNDWRYVLGERVRDLYSDLYAIDTSIHASPENEIKGAISRVTGQEEEAVKRYFATFKTLASLAKFEPRPTKQSVEPVQEARERIPAAPNSSIVEAKGGEKAGTAFHYNIQIHLPATTDVTVYNAIFRSLKDNLDI